MNERVRILCHCRAKSLAMFPANSNRRSQARTRPKVEKSFAANPEAYQLYLKGIFYWNKRNPESLKKSIEFFNQAIEKDPAYALAYAGLAEAYVLLPEYYAGTP